MDPHDRLGLQPHPEGGWFRETWRSGHDVTLPGYDGPRATATSILYSLGDGEESAWHRVASDELWLHHSGPALVLGLARDLPGADADVEHRLGADLDAGEQPQVLVPAGWWQRARPAGQGRALVTCVVSPGFDYADFDLADGARPGEDGAMTDTDDTTQQVLDSATKLLAEQSDRSVNDQYVADDTGLPVGVVRDALVALGDGVLSTQVFEDGSISVLGLGEA
ncbi:MAG: cupin domain-containing protein [Nocardioidaceae bacterium]|nr:cupin domain-containing protein [Nocardioidaceae bacterium]